MWAFCQHWVIGNHLSIQKCGNKTNCGACVRSFLLLISSLSALCMGMSTSYLVPNAIHETNNVYISTHMSWTCVLYAKDNVQYNNNPKTPLSHQKVKMSKWGMIHAAIHKGLVRNCIDVSTTLDPLSKVIEVWSWIVTIVSTVSARSQPPPFLKNINTDPPGLYPHLFQSNSTNKYLFSEIHTHTPNPTPIPSRPCPILIIRKPFRVVQCLNGSGVTGCLKDPLW